MNRNSLCGREKWGKERLLVVYVCVWWIDDGGCMFTVT